MKRARRLPFLLSALALAGCGTVSDVVVKTAQVMMDPSIQVGDAHDQLSKFTLSLYASPTVNPNPNSVPVSEEEDGEYEEIYSINLSSDSKEDLAAKMRVVLAQLQAAEDQKKLGDVLATRMPLQLAPYLRIGPKPEPGRKSVVPGILPFMPGLPYIDQPPLLELDTGRYSLSGIHEAAKNPNDEAESAQSDSQSHTAAQRKRTASQRASANSALIADDPYNRSYYEPSEYDSRALGEYGTEMSDAGNLEEEALAPHDIATPVAFKVLQLKDDTLLLNADYDALSKDLKKTLGSTYISSEDYILKPGQYKFLNIQTIDKDTRYIAVIASFHDMNEANWKSVLRIEPTGRNYALLVSLNDTEAVIQDEHDSNRPELSASKPKAARAAK